MAILGIDHLAIAVTDLEASERNWRDNFGLTVEKRTESEGLGIQQVYMAFPNGGSLELFTPTDDSSPMAAVLEESGEGFQAVSLEVDNVEATLSELEANGVRTFTQGGTTFIHPKSANGLIISLTQRE